MRAEIITIGDEILIGQIIDTNSAWIATELNKIGVVIHQITSISDDKQHILKALNDAFSRVDIVLVTGGLGPTNDDITKKTLAEYFESEMETNLDVLNDIELLLSKHSIPMNALNYQQASVPKKCTVIRNPVGTAPVMWFNHQNSVLVSMPGVPFEMMNSMENEIIPRLKKHFKTPFIRHKTIILSNISESALAQKLIEFEANLPELLKLAYLPSIGCIRLRLSMVGDNEEMLKNIIHEKVSELYRVVGEYIWGENEDTFESVVGKLLCTKNASLSIAESCTGGSIAKLISSIPGCSTYFVGSVVAYQNSIKQAFLKVKQYDLDHFGAVSREVVEQMAKGALELFNSDYAVSTSGIAGPEGGSDEKPVGTIWIAVASKKGLVSKKFIFRGNRDQNNLRASMAALNMLRVELLEP